MDFYFCNNDNLNLIISTKAGDTFEIVFFIKSLIFNTGIPIKYKSEEHLYDYNISTNLIISFPPYSVGNIRDTIIPNITFSIHPFFPIITIIGSDKTIRFYDYGKKRLIIAKELGLKCSCCTFSPDGTLLVVGFETGTVMFFDTKMSSQNLEVNQNYYLPKLESVLTIRTGVTPVLAIKFSAQSDFVCISYDNKKNKLNDYISGSYISIYIKQNSSLMNFKKKIESEGFYIKVSDFNIPISQFEINNLDRNSSATTSIDFSEDSKYILISSHKVNEFDKKNNATKSIFIIWDIINNQVVYDDNILKNLKFREISISKAVYMKDFSSYYEPMYISDFLNNCLMKNPDYINSKDPDNIYNQLIIIYTMNSLNSYDSVIAGSMDGGLYILNKLDLYTHKEENINLNTRNNFINLFDKDLKLEKEINYEIEYPPLTHGKAKLFPAHCGCVSKIECSQDNFNAFTSGIFDQNIIQWRVINQDLFSNLDFFPIIPIAATISNNPKENTKEEISMDLKLINDPYEDIINYNQFNIFNKGPWIVRYCIFLENIAQEKIMNKYLPTYINMNFNRILNMKRIFGRKAKDCFQTLDIDSNENVVYMSTCYIIILSYDSDLNFKQSFFIPDQTSHYSLNREINCFKLSYDKKLIAIGLKGLNAAITVWELNSKLQISHTEIENCRTIQFLNFDKNRKNLVGIGLQENYITMVFIYNIFESRITHSYLDIDSPVFKIKDVQFMYESSDELISVGLQHISFWKIFGSQLIPFHISISDEKLHYGYEENTIKNNNIELVSLKENYGINKLSSLVINGVRNSLIPDNFELQEYNEYAINSGFSKNDITLRLKSTYTCIVTIGKNILIGTEDGVILFFSNNKYTHRIKYARSPITNLITDNSNSIVILSCQDGKLSVYNIDYSSDNVIIQLLIKGVIEDQCEDYNKIKYFSIKSVSLGLNKLIYGTMSGDIHVLNFPKEIITHYKIITRLNTPREVTISNVDHDPPICCTFDYNNEYIFLLTAKGTIFCQKIELVATKNKMFLDKPALFIHHFIDRNYILVAFYDSICAFDLTRSVDDIIIYKKLNHFEIILGKISYVKISYNNKYIAVVTLINNNPSVHLYEILSTGFSPINIFTGFNSEIVCVDFDKNTEFIYIEDKLSNPTFIKLNSKKQIGMEETQNVDWINGGLKFSNYFECLRRIYTDLSQVTYYFKHPKLRVMILGDINGCIRFFNYPAVYNDGYFYSQNDHTGAITYIGVSNDLKYLITLSVESRATMIYEINSCLINDELENSINSDSDNDSFSNK